MQKKDGICRLRGSPIQRLKSCIPADPTTLASQRPSSPLEYHELPKKRGRRKRTWHPNPRTTTMRLAPFPPLLSRRRERPSRGISQRKRSSLRKRCPRNEAQILMMIKSLVSLSSPLAWLQMTVFRSCGETRTEARETSHRATKGAKRTRYRIVRRQQQEQERDQGEKTQSAGRSGAHARIYRYKCWKKPHHGKGQSFRTSQSSEKLLVKTSIERRSVQERESVFQCQDQTEAKGYLFYRPYVQCTDTSL